MRPTANMGNNHEAPKAVELRLSEPSDPSRERGIHLDYEGTCFQERHTIELDLTAVLYRALCSKDKSYTCDLSFVLPS